MQHGNRLKLLGAQRGGFRCGGAKMSKSPPENAAIKTALSGRSIVLVGLMGAGKSTVGRRLANALGVKFLDADHEIEEAAAMKVAEIFEKYGEEHFRDGERKVMARLLTDDAAVIATGGGAFMNDETRALIKDRAISVWLKAELELLLERVMRRDTRPLLRTGDPRDILGKLMSERHPIYAEANIVIETGDGPHEFVVKDILAGLKSYLGIVE